jgi:hypothetical protein
MNSDQEIIHEFVDRKSSATLINELHAKLLERQSKYIRNAPMIPNVSSIMVKDEGYIDKLGVSSPRDLITDNWGKLLASLWCQTNAAGVSVSLTDTSGNPQTVQHHNWNTSSSSPTSGRSGFFGPGGGSSMSNTTLCYLGTGLTPVARSDYAVETPCTGALGTVLSGLGAGYGSAQVTWSQVSAPATVANDVAESAICKQGNIQSNGNLMVFCLLRYNYTPTTIAIGKTAVIDTTITV